MGQIKEKTAEINNAHFMHTFVLPSFPRPARRAARHPAPLRPPDQVMSGTCNGACNFLSW